MSIDVLVIDDHSLIRMATKQLIDQQPDMRCVDAVADLETAATILETTSLEVVLCDLQFSDGNALAFISEWAGRGPHHILVSSAHRPEVYAPLCSRAGAKGYIHKSNNCQALIDAVRAVAESKIESEFIGCQSDDDSGAMHEQLSALTAREWEVLNQIGRGFATKEIAKNLFLSAKTVESHRASIKRKLAIRSKDYLASFAAELSLRVG